MVRGLAEAISLLLLVAVSGCGPGLINDPCEREEDCAEELICDIHAGEDDGSCQEPHLH